MKYTHTHSFILLPRDFQCIWLGILALLSQLAHLDPSACLWTLSHAFHNLLLTPDIATQQGSWATPGWAGFLQPL